MSTDRPTLATFLFAAPDRPGHVAKLAGFFYELGLNIVDASNHTDPHAETGPRFYMRIVQNESGRFAASAFLSAHYSISQHTIK